MYYILDHCHAIDHLDFCRVMRTLSAKIDPAYSMYDVAEILTAIQFYFEENVSYTRDPDLDGVIELLEKAFPFRTVGKEPMKDILENVLETEEGCGYQAFNVYLFNNETYVYIDLYEARERLCGPGRPEKLYAKWLSDELKAGILKLEPVL